MNRAIAKISGGTGSYSAARRYVQQHGSQNLELLFTDTLCEDQDAYRFLVAGAAKLYGIELPKGFIPSIDDFPAWEDRTAYKAFCLHLGLETTRLIPRFHWIADGRDPWDVYEHERFLGNSLADPCSKVLKRQLADRWLKQNCDPTETEVIVGIDIEEIERFEGSDIRKTRGLRRRMADDGWIFIAPLCQSPISSYNERLGWLAEDGLWLPRLNQLGFSHNNCGGFCCKGGQGHWKLMLRVFPERYAYAEYRENQIRQLLGNVSMLTDRRGDGKKKILTLTNLRNRTLTEEEASDLGGCHCFFEDVA